MKTAITDCQRCDIVNEGLGIRHCPLHAAAPVLLDACMDTLTRLEWWSGDPANRSLDAAFIALNAALKLAEKGE